MTLNHQKNLVSVVVPAYNAAKILPACLSALQNQTRPPDEIIVVDDGSTDETIQTAMGCGAMVIEQAHQGPAAARNLGIERARGDLVLFTDADCEPLPDWVDKMIAPLADPQVVGVKGIYRTRQSSPTARFVQAEYEDKYDLMSHHATIDFIDTYAAAYRRSVYIENGGMDPHFPRASGEDIDFSYRLAQHGYKLVLARCAAVYHRHPDTVTKYLRRKYHVGYWRVRMYKKHPEKMVADSHTPQSLKLQMGLLGAIALAWVGSLYSAIGWEITLVLVALFGISILPFMIKTWGRDKLIAILAPMFLALRALALDVGFMIGLIAQLWEVIHQ
jgi:glycosyltransferase involved in cell wall biosynthesis